MISRRILCLSLAAIVTGCDEATWFAFMSGDASSIGARIYADDRLIGKFEESVGISTAEKFARAKGLRNGYGPYNVPQIPRTAKLLRVIHADGRALSVAVPQGPGVELYGGVNFTEMTISLS